MSNLKCFGVLLFLLSVTACIGSSGSLAHMVSNTNQRPYGSTELDGTLNQHFIGMTRDELIIRYGLPNRTASLDNGYKLMQYNSKQTIIHNDGHRDHLNCELRLWLQDKKVHHVDYLGDEAVCNKFAATTRRDRIDDDRLHLTNEYRL